ncbi:MAG: tryptophan 7-halogenase [Lentisphaeraceae bacterium]|nr:tryptophan 7-halogenase [Lentisphaeraceae bacterium]
MTSDIAVIGAGPASSAISAILSQNGFSVTVLEKNHFPRFSIGESLLPQCMDFLKEAGILSAVTTDDFQIKKGALFARGSQHAKIDFSEKFTAGPSETWQVLRSEFDCKLIDKSAEYGTKVIYGCEVKDVSFSEGQVDILYSENDVSKELTAKFIIDASGGAMVLPRLMKNVSQPEVSKVSLFTHFQGDSRDLEQSENILISVNPLNKKIWYWGIPLKNDVLSVGVVTDSETLSSFSGDSASQFEKVLAQEPNLVKRLQCAKPVRVVSKIQAYEAKVEKVYGDRFLLIGNAGGFIDPIFSSGLTVALKSAVLGAKEVMKFLKGQKPDWTAYCREMDIGNETFRAYVDSWYEGTLQDIILMDGKEAEIQKKINSILAGYVWDQTNSFVKEPKRKLQQVAGLIRRFQKS